MARFTADDMDKYGGQGGTGYFSLKNDMDVATVRFLYDTVKDVEGYAVHEVEIDGKKRYVNCLREYNQPIDDCPFCRAKKYQVVKLFIPLYNEDEGKVQVWERGKKFLSKLSGVLSRCRADSLVQQKFEIERHGKSGDTQTQYEIFETKEGPDDATLEDFEEPVIMGRLILDKSADDMEFYLENKYFPPEDEAPTRRSESSRRNTRRDDEQEEMPRRRTRRTPSDTF